MKSAACQSDTPDKNAAAPTVEGLQAALEKQTLVIVQQQQRIAMLEAYLRLERARQYGRSSEKHPAQGEIFNEAELAACESEAEAPDTAAEAEHKPATGKKGRKGLSPQLPREQIHLNLSEEEKAGAVSTFYSLVKEELDIVPAKVRVLEYLQEKAVFIDQGERRIEAATLPTHPLGKAVASVGLLAYIIVAKYADALPLYRLEKIFQRYGGNVTRTTMANWLIRLSEQLQPLINLMREHQLGATYLQADETRLQVLKEPGRAATSDKWMWLIRGGPPGQPAVLFEYDPSRSSEIPLRLLDGFTGYLQTDGYAGYNAVCRANGISQLGCFDHARRKFVDAKKAEPATGKQSGKVSKTDVALAKIRKLYAIEETIKELPTAEKYQQRQARSLPLLAELKAWLDHNVHKVSKDGLTRTAMDYALNQWPKLIRYCEDGELNISNALAENAIRPLAVGRRNWLFADTPKGAQASAMYYSLIESAKANGLEPYDYLHRVLKQLAYADSVEKLEALLPWNMK